MGEGVPWMNIFEVVENNKALTNLALQGATVTCGATSPIIMTLLLVLQCHTQNIKKNIPTIP